MSDTTIHKNRLREQLRQHRRTLTSAEQHSAGESVSQLAQSLPNWQHASNVALYLAADGELDTLPLVNLCRQQKKLIYLPVAGASNRLVFAQWQPADRLVKNRFGIPEPPANAVRREVNGLDIIFLPLVGWDDQGNRLGMGGGFYDRTLATAERPLRVGLAHDCQQVKSLPRDAWDISLDFIVTGTVLLRCQGDRE